jgi:hypothetical protein
MGGNSTLKNIENYRYDINQDNVVEIWNDDNPNENDAPFLRQPVNPLGMPWADFDEAEKWTKEYIDYLLNPSAPVEESTPAADTPSK